MDMPIEKYSHDMIISQNIQEGDMVQFSEVRVCRLLTYVQDRADIGKPLLDKVLPLLLTRCAKIHPDCNLSLIPVILIFPINIMSVLGRRM